MRRLLVVILIMAATVASGQPFYRQTKHKPIKRMSRVDVRKAQKGVNMYTRENGKVVRNNGRAWTRMSKPKDNANTKPKRSR